MLYNYPPASGDLVFGYSFIPCELSSAVGFDHPWHQAKGVITQEEVVQIWPSLPQWFSCWEPQAAVLDLLPQKASAVNLSPNHLTHSLSTGFGIRRPPGPGEPGKKALVVVIVTACFLWLLHGDVLPI